MTRPLPLFLAALICLIVPTSALAVKAAGVQPAAPIAGPAAPAGAAKALLPLPTGNDRDRATVRIKLRGLRNRRAMIMSKVRVVGSVAPFKRGQVVRVTFFRNGRKAFSKKAKVYRGKPGDGRGRFRSFIRLRRGGRYAVSARLAGTPGLKGDRTIRKRFRPRYKGLAHGSCNRVVLGFKHSLKRLGYVPGGGRCFNGKLERAVLAFRKVNGLARTERASKGIVKQAYLGVGGWRVRHPGAGDHVEASLAHQVLVFAKGRRVYAVYPISSGAPSTPTVQGHFTFGTYTQRGYNNLGMYYSYYFYGGYAVHGYHSVPDYPASHGCLRTFIADQPEIFNRIYPGLDIFVF